MCLGVPAKVIDVYERDGMRLALVEVGGTHIEAIVALEEEINPEDYVIIHAGIVISKIREEELDEILNIWRELEREFEEIVRS